MYKASRFAAGALALAFISSTPSVRADVVTDWNRAFEQSLPVPAQRGPRVPTRALAIMHVAMFDAVNGIDRKYQPYAVHDLAPPGARADAAAMQAAYRVLTTLLPTHQAAYEVQLQASLAKLSGHQGNSKSIERGRAWGDAVAQAVIAARAGDGSTTVLAPFVGETTVGYWRHAPLGASPTAAYASLATIPFVIPIPTNGQPPFNPGPPYGSANRAAALTSASYAADVNEARARGGAVSAVRTAAELETALYVDATDFMSLNGVLRSKTRPTARLVDTARSFALLNIAGFDVPVALFRSKYHHALWRPFQAIRYGDLDGNAATTKDETWTSFLPTPPHPEYPSAHVTIFAAMLQLIARLEGDSGPVVFTAAASTAYPGGTKTFASLADIATTIGEGRIDIGFHFRETCDVSQIIGRSMGDYIADSALSPLSQP